MEILQEWRVCWLTEHSCGSHGHLRVVGGKKQPHADCCNLRHKGITAFLFLSSHLVCTCTKWCFTLRTRIKETQFVGVFRSYREGCDGNVEVLCGLFWKMGFHHMRAMCSNLLPPPNPRNAQKTSDLHFWWIQWILLQLTVFKRLKFWADSVTIALTFQDIIKTPTMRWK